MLKYGRKHLFSNYEMDHLSSNDKYPLKNSRKSLN